MNDIKKYTAIAGGVVIVACWPLVVGQIGQNLIHDNIARADDSKLKLAMVSYDRGYLSSHLVTKIEVVDPEVKSLFESESLPTEWFLDSDISHSLFTLDGVTTFRDYDDIPFQVLTKTQLSGDTHIDAELESFEYVFADTEQGWSMSMQPSHLLADVTLEEITTASFNMLEMKLTNQVGEFFTLTDLQSTAQGKMQNNLWIGDQGLTIKSIEAGSPDDESLSVMEGFSYSITANRAEPIEKDALNTPALYSSQTVINVDKVITAEQQVDDITLDIVTGDFDADNLSVLLDVLQSENPQQSEQQAIAAIDGLVNSGLFISVDKLGFSYLNQPIDANLQINIASGTEHISQAPMELLSILDGGIFVQVPKALVEQVPNLQQGIDQLRSKEYIVETDTDFEFSATIEDGNIVFSNGQKTPIFSALMPLFMR